MFRSLFNANLNLWPKKSRSVGVVLLRYCIRVQELLESDRNLTDEDKKKMKDAIKKALDALELLNNGYKYNERNAKDPIELAKMEIRSFVPRKEWTPPTEDDDKNKVATATKMIREITGSAPPLRRRYSVDVKLCDSSKGSVNPISEMLEYSFTGDNYTLDDLLYILRLRRPNSVPQFPFLYCRPVGEHLYTHEGSKFQRRRPFEPLKGLSRSGQDGAGVVYVIAPEPKFVILVKGVSRREGVKDGDGLGAKDRDGFYIVHRFDDWTTDVIAESQSQTRTFHHISGACPGYTCESDARSELTWKQHKHRRQLTLYEGEWVVCVPREDEV